MQLIQRPVLEKQCPKKNKKSQGRVGPCGRPSDSPSIHSSFPHRFSPELIKSEAVLGPSSFVPNGVGHGKHKASLSVPAWEGTAI
jgi:hypothetical protein